MALTKADILGTSDLVTEKIDTPEWAPAAPFVYVRTMSGAERDAYEVEQFQINGKDVSVNRLNVRARLLVRCISDEAGNRLFEDSDAESLGNKSAKVLDRLFGRAQVMNGLTKQDIDELAKNSGGALNSGSGTGSPVI